MQGRQCAKTSENFFISASDFFCIVDSVISNYPNVYRFEKEDIEMIRSHFVGLTDDEIIRNVEVIESFYNAFMQYDIVNKIRQTSTSLQKANGQAKAPKSDPDHYLGNPLNSDEFWYIVTHPLNKEPIEKAKTKAEELTKLKCEYNG